MDADYVKATEEACKLIERTISNLAAKYSETRQIDDPSKRLFFPSGVELIYLKFKVANGIEISLAISGENAKYPPSIVSETLGFVESTLSKQDSE